MTYIYLYLAIGIIISALSFVSYKRNENDVAEAVDEKLHELSNDGSFSFQSANFIGHLLAFIVGALFWPVLIIKKIVNRLTS